MNFLITLLLLLIILSVIIIVHEFGHFIAAKKGGVYVDEFSLGMGPQLLKYKPKKSETTYSLRAFPIGGFVSMAEKEDPDDKKIKKDRVLENKSFGRKLLVLINGILFNCFLAIFLFFVSGLFYGRPVNEPVIHNVVDGMGAAKAGLESGDKILEVNGVRINTWDDFLLEASAKKLKSEYIFKIEKSNGEIKEYSLVPDVQEVEGQEVKVFGIQSSGTTYYKGFKNAIIYAFEGFYTNFKTIFKILGNLFTGEVPVKSLSGPVGIYSLVDNVKSQGFNTLLYLTAYLSINVAIINLIPVPVFDGGRVLILLIEKITKKKSSEKLEIILNYAGFLLMILLMLYVTFNDIVRLVVK